MARKFVSIVALAVLVSACGGGDEAEPEILAGVQTFDDQGAEHFTDQQLEAILSGTPLFEYNSLPPTSGPHAATWAPCGIWREEIPDVFLIHSMEHGAVVAHYDPSISDQERQRLEDKAREFGRYVVTVPRSGATAPLILTAWTAKLDLTSVDIDAFEAFWNEYSGRGPERVPCNNEIDQA